MSEDSYINRRGYVVYKKNTSIEEMNKIKDELTVKPYIPKSTIELNSFTIYRESHSKYYLPRFYGINLFGNTLNKLSKGNPINLNFTGSLRDYQNVIVDKFVKHIDKSGGGLLEIDTGLGKTVIALNIIAKLQVKTLIIVHKEFLMNQWIERIKEFLPDASIGKIQGQNISISCDIVIGMLQSLSMKDYDESIFDSFGFIIIDEVHHMGAEVFSQALLKVNTNYCLGLSATMNRKDGLTKVFKMFLGDIVHTEKRKTENSVLVKVIDFNNNDEEFNEMKYNFKGDPLYSSMISKLCAFNIRSEFIINLIHNELEINPNQHIIVLAHNRSLLKYFFNSISHHNKHTVGYYVGGMKEEELKKSESNKIILATYSMAAEGLDIKTLTTLVMATPKSDIVQAVGRILRVNHSEPLVIDIVDPHDIFKNQFNKRKAFYKKQKYKMIRSNNNDYFINKWDEITSSKKKTESNNCPFKI